jgi:hypothetical protein
MRILLELFVPRSEGVSAEFRLWDESGRKVLAVVQIPKTERSPLASALLALPDLVKELANAGVKELGWKGFVPSGRLRPASAWLLYGEVREPDLLESRKKALEIAKSAGIKFDTDPAEGKVGKLGELDLSKLLVNAGKGSSSASNSSVRSRLK